MAPSVSDQSDHDEGQEARNSQPRNRPCGESGRVRARRGTSWMRGARCERWGRGLLRTVGIG